MNRMKYVIHFNEENYNLDTRKSDINFHKKKQKKTVEDVIMENEQKCNLAVSVSIDRLHVFHIIRINIKSKVDGIFISPLLIKCFGPLLGYHLTCLLYLPILVI